MQSYTHGLEALAGAEPEPATVPVEVQHDSWHRWVTFVGMLASLATLWSVLVLQQRGRR
jgi:hypothetical protein